MMEQIYVRHVELLGYEKRFFPNQHFVYMLIVKWSDLSEKLIYRRYPEIHTFHKTLKEMFPIEAGQIEKKDRIIPSLPAPRWVDSEKSTETRQSTLTEYSRSLLGLPPHISRSKLLCDFFRVRPEDESPPAPNPTKRNETFVLSSDNVKGNITEISGPIILESYRAIADYTNTSKHEIALHSGELVEIVEKSNNGWWFCQGESKRGWVPASYLEPLDGPEESEEQQPNYEGELYITKTQYRAEQDDELTLEVGDSVEVIHKLLDGWWVVRRGEETGHVPSMFLQSAGRKDLSESDRNTFHRRTPPPRRRTIRNAQSIHKKGRQRLSQESYRRNSKRFMQQRNRGNPRPAAQQESVSPDNAEPRKQIPVVPPRPSPELIMERCTSDTCSKVSVCRTSEPAR